VKVIGAGFGRTGTWSLKVALEMLGFGPCYHMTEVFAHPGHADLWVSAWREELVDWEGVVGDYEVSVDWPACTFYEELMDQNPGAKVLLSVRDPESWYESTRATVYELSKLLDSSTLARLVFGLSSLLVFGGFAGGRSSLVNDIIWQGTFHGHFEDKAYAIEVYNQHNDEVKRRVPPERLLVYEVKEGWEPLCAFLGIPVPEEPFPRLNDAVLIRRGITAVRVLAATLPVALTLTAGLTLVLLLRGRHRARAV
jgi:Sulfotransferase domain